MPKEKETEDERFNHFTNLFGTMAQQFIALIESNNNLLIENLRLMKENNDLRQNQRPCVI